MPGREGAVGEGEEEPDRGRVEREGREGDDRGADVRVRGPARMAARLPEREKGDDEGEDDPAEGEEDPLVPREPLDRGREGHRRHGRDVPILLAPGVHRGDRDVVGRKGQEPRDRVEDSPRVGGDVLHEGVDPPEGPVPRRPVVEPEPVRIERAGLHPARVLRRGDVNLVVPGLGHPGAVRREGGDEARHSGRAHVADVDHVAVHIGRCGHVERDVDRLELHRVHAEVEDRGGDGRGGPPRQG